MKYGDHTTILLFANGIIMHHFFKALRSSLLLFIKTVPRLQDSIEKAKQFKFDLNDAVLASDAFFPFDDCVRIAHAAGITAFIQPGGSIRDVDSIEYCKQNGLVMVLTGTRHFKH